MNFDALVNRDELMGLRAQKVTITHQMWSKIHFWCHFVNTEH